MFAFAAPSTLSRIRRRQDQISCCPHKFRLEAVARFTPNEQQRTSLGPFQNVNPLGIGTWAWGNKLLFDYDPSLDNTLQETFNKALLNGVNLIDTADSYGTGNLNARAEKLLGRFLSEAPISTDHVIIATKFASYPWRITRSSICDAAARSAERIGRPIDIGQMHWSTTTYAPWQERALIDGLADAKERGYCRQIGVSNFGPMQLRKVCEYLERERGMKLASCQVQLSLLSRLPLENGLIQLARQMGVGVIGYSPLCLGLLTGKYDEKGATGVRGILFGKLLKGSSLLTRTLREIGDARGVTAAQVAIGWCLSKGVVVITGVREPQHVEQGVDSVGLVLSEREISELEAVASKCPQMIQNSFQTR